MNFENFNFICDVLINYKEETNIEKNDEIEVSFKPNLKKMSSETQYFTEQQSCFTGQQLVNILKIPAVSVTNKATTIGIICAYYYKNTISDFKQYWNTNFPNSVLPNVSMDTSLITNSLINSNSNSINGDFSIETCLDVQAIATINPAAQIKVIFANSSSVSDMINAIHYANTVSNCDIVSFSYGSKESRITSRSITALETELANCVCFCASSGDNNYVAYPSTSTNAISVGGVTSLWTPNSADNLNVALSTWHSAGCGYSTLFSTPNFQKDLNKTANRCIPDLVSIANPSTGLNIYCYDNVNSQGFLSIGGTSLSCPIIVGLISLANQIRLNSNKKVLTTAQVQSFIYNLNNKNNFIDIVNGTDGVYSTATGYDVATGMGFPIASVFVTNLSAVV